MDITKFPVKVKVFLREYIRGGEKIRGAAELSFGDIQIGDRVETIKGYPKACGCQAFCGVIIGKEVLSDQEELEEKYPFLYAETNPFVVVVKTTSGEEERVNITWLKKEKNKRKR